MAKKRLPKGVRERNGKYHYRYDIIDPITGKRKQKETRGYETPKEAEREGIRIQAEQLAGTFVDEKNVTFEDFSKEWLTYYDNTGRVKVSTIRVRDHEIRRLAEHFNRIKLKDITRPQYQKALNMLHKELADNTIDGIHRTARMIFRRAIEVGAIKSDPTEYAYVPKTRKTVEELEEEVIPKYLEKEELAAFLKAATDHGIRLDRQIFFTLAYTGMRIGELAALKWSDIDENDNTISITKTYYNPNNIIADYQLLTPKTKTSRRIIDVDSEVISVIKELLLEQRETKMAHRKTYHDNDFIFTLDKFPGYPIYLKLIGIRMARLLKITKLNQSFTPHSLRHTHTSLLSEAGVSLEQIMQRLGHSDDKTTRTIYLHVTKSRKVEASHKFSELMRGIKN